MYGRNNPLRFLDPTGLLSDVPDLDLSEIEIDITPPQMTNPSNIVFPQTLNALNSFQIVPIISELILNSPNVDLATIAEGIKSVNPKINIEIVNRNKIVISTSKIASREYVDLGSIKIDGEVIQIEKNSIVDKETGEITTNYKVHISDRLIVISSEPEEGSAPIKDAMGTTLGNAGPGFIGISASMCSTILSLDVKFTSSGYIQAEGSFGCDSLGPVLLAKAFITLPNGEKVYFDRKVSEKAYLGTPSMPKMWYDLNISLTTESLINKKAKLEFTAVHVVNGPPGLNADQIRLEMYLGYNQQNVKGD